MREVAPGDLVFPFVDTRIFAVGVVRSYCYESPKPVEFGAIGMNWEQIGWRVRVDFTVLQSRIHQTGSCSSIHSASLRWSSSLLGR